MLAAVTTVRVAAPQLKMLREEIVSTISGFDAAKLAHAHTAYVAASGPLDVLPQLAERAIELRDQLFADAQALGRYKLVDAKRLGEIKGGTGFANAAPILRASLDLNAWIAMT